MKKIFVLGIMMFSFAALFAAKSAKEYVADLSSDDKKTVIEAAKWLGSNKEKSAVAPLLNLLQTSSDSEIKVESACALGLIGEKSVVRSLSAIILTENNSDVRYTIVLAIARLGIDSKESYNNLLQAKEKETDPFIKDFIVKMEEKFSKSK